MLLTRKVIYHKDTFVSTINKRFVLDNQKGLKYCAGSLETKMIIRV